MEPSSYRPGSDAESTPSGRWYLSGVPRYVFVVTYGRSGSTLMQGILNTLPGALVRGENNFYVLHLYRAWSSLEAYRRRFAKPSGSKGVRSAFFGVDESSPEQFADDVRRLVTHQLLGTVDPSEVSLLGFKEVLWYSIRPSETEEFFDFLDAVFPDARYILHRRDHDKVSASGYWVRRKPAEVQRSLQRVEEIQEHLARTRPGRVLRTRYEQLTSEDPAEVDAELRKVAELVQVPCDEALLAKLRETMSVAFGPNPFGGNAGR